jgi:hypothetical protein
MVRLQRWCLQDLAIELTEKRGFDVIIDFASGLPTNDHIHHVVPEGTTVIYSDYDPVVVENAREILVDTPNTHYFQADARRPEELLNRQAVQDILKGRRDVAVIYWGIAAFLVDDELAHAARTLYEWSGPNACWVFQAQGVDVDNESESWRRVLDIYTNMGTPIHLRTLPELLELVKPWHADDLGFVSLLDWHSMDKDTMSEEDVAAFGASGGAYGAYLLK